MEKDREKERMANSNMAKPAPFCVRTTVPQPSCQQPHPAAIFSTPCPTARQHKPFRHSLLQTATASASPGNAFDDKSTRCIPRLGTPPTTAGMRPGCAQYKFQLNYRVPKCRQMNAKGITLRPVIRYSIEPIFGGQSITVHTKIPTDDPKITPGHPEIRKQFLLPATLFLNN
jgi:hypothetical protein